MNSICLMEELLEKCIADGFCSVSWHQFLSGQHKISIRNK